jgi:hypothetical protein
MHNHLYYTDSYTVQVVDGKVGEPGLFIAEIPFVYSDLAIKSRSSPPCARVVGYFDFDADKDLVALWEAYQQRRAERAA